MPAPDTTDALAPLRKLAGPDQAGALRAQCATLGRRLAQLRAANSEHWLRLSEATGRIEAGQLAARQALDAIEQNNGERGALLDRYQILLSMREEI